MRVGDVLRLDRIPIQPDPNVEYVSIGVRSFGKGIFHYERKLGNELGRLRFFEVQPDHLIVSNIKGWEGAIAVSSPADASCIASSRFLSYKPIDNRIDVRWARWYFLSEPGIEMIRRASPGSADRNRTLAIDRFEALMIPLPPIGEQKLAADRLDNLHHTVMSGIQPQSAENQTLLRSLTDAYLHQMLEELRERSTELAELGDLGTWSSGGTPSAKEPSYYGGGIPWAVIGDLNDGLVLETERTLTQLGIDQSSAKIVAPGTLLVAMYGSIGKLGIAGLHLATNQAIATCKPAQGVTSDFLMSLLRCLRMELMELGQGGAQQNISQGLLKSVVVPKPDTAGQQQFVSRVNQHLEGISRIRLVMRRRGELTQSLIPAALTKEFASLN